MPDILSLEHEGAEAAGGLPALLADAQSLAATLMAGAHGRRRPGTGETFWQYRDYTQGDPASAIDWRQSARSPNRLYVRETEWETAATLRLWCDGSEGFDYRTGQAPAKRWRGQVMTLALALLLVRAGEKVGLLAPPGPARGGHRAVAEAAEQLLAHPGETTLPPLPPPGTTQTVYISDFHVPTDELVHRVTAIAAAGIPCHFVQIADEAEETFPFEGRTLFEAPGNPQRHRLFGDATSVRDEYATRRTAHREAFRDVCRRYGFTLFSHTTSQPAATTLAALHHAISGERQQ